jgi:FdhE protein
MSRILEPGEIESAVAAPFLRLPERRVFEERAARFEELAPGNMLGDYLVFLAKLARAQQQALNVFPEVPLPGEEELRRSLEYRMPPLGVHGWRRDPGWRHALAQILAAVEVEALPPPAAVAVARLSRSGADELEKLAEALLAGDYAGIDRAGAVFVAAALQVYWTHMALTLRAGDAGRLEQPNLCPVCGSLPVASIVRIGGAEEGLRYLSCSLCSAEWNMVRIKCTHCDTAKGPGYYAIEGGPEAVKAEACNTCDSYLKIMYMGKDARVNPVADDIATMALDLLMAENGRERCGPNLFLLPGED